MKSFKVNYQERENAGDWVWRMRASALSPPVLRSVIERTSFSLFGHMKCARTQEVDLERKAAIGRGADAEMRVSSLHQQIKSKQSEIQVSSGPGIA